jgi:hypothetical protein
MIHVRVILYCHTHLLNGSVVFLICRRYWNFTRVSNRELNFLSLLLTSSSNTEQNSSIPELRREEMTHCLQSHNQLTLPCNKLESSMALIHNPESVPPSPTLTINYHEINFITLTIFLVFQVNVNVLQGLSHQIPYFCLSNQIYMPHSIKCPRFCQTNSIR